MVSGPPPSSTHWFLSCDWLRTFTQVDGQPAASASMNIDAPIAGEPEVEATAEVTEVQAVCVL